MPRLFIARYHGRVYLFDCDFDAGAEDYPDTYKVRLIGEEDAKSKNWLRNIRENTPPLGEVKVADVKFDATQRKEMDAAVLESFL